LSADNLSVSATRSQLPLPGGFDHINGVHFQRIVQNVHMEKIFLNLCGNVTKIAYSNVRLRQFYNFITFFGNVSIINIIGKAPLYFVIELG